MISKVQINLILIIVLTFVTNVASQELTLLSSEDGFCTYLSKSQRIEQVESTFEYLDKSKEKQIGFQYVTHIRMVNKTRLEPQTQIKEKTEEIVRCCDGYYSNSIKDKCLPICDHHCIHGNCTNVNVCTCYDGYTLGKDSHNVCIPHCGGCTNGHCVFPNICNCFDGFELSHNENFTCIPMLHFTERLLNNRSSFILSLTLIFIVIIGTVSGIYWFRRKRMLTEESRYDESGISVICHLSEEL